MATDTNTILAERGSRYGTFADNAATSQALKRIMAQHLAKHNKEVADDQWEAMEMIAHKLSRIINGDPDFIDNFRDIAGYATLVADRLEETDGATNVRVVRTVRKEGVWRDENGTEKN